jgi:hypothetical protein
VDRRPLPVESPGHLARGRRRHAGDDQRRRQVQARRSPADEADTPRARTSGLSDPYNEHRRAQVLGDLAQSASRPRVSTPSPSAVCFRPCPGKQPPRAGSAPWRRPGCWKHPFDFLGALMTSYPICAFLGVTGSESRQGPDRAGVYTVWGPAGKVHHLPLAVAISRLPGPPAARTSSGPVRVRL